ncbi:hypothetical protein YIM73518_25180 [Thermus brockianus]|jgi:alpha-tubulin suppressor-like RCC1 family protein|uniref:Regulator of chromosome condensation (RCC1) repeat protein n=2 Tax=Thermaceae TaxID=188786 RepID=A0A1J0LYC8_THEBO|nr:Regulator of chromosome condensation (RCC1) repeat protein [Thermus brockianus]
MGKRVTFLAFVVGCLAVLSGCAGPTGSPPEGGNGTHGDPMRFQGILAAGTDFVLLVKPDGVYGWGDNRFGQLAEDPDTLPFRSTPAKIPGLDEAIAVAAQFGIGENQRHALALMGDGRLQSWGVNPYGQLGRPQGYPTGTRTFEPPDYVVAEGGSEHLANAVAIEAGRDFSLVIHVRDNERRVLGFGDNVNHSHVLTQNDDWYYDPRPLLRAEGQPLVGVQSVDAGDGHALLLLEDGTVWTTGSNSHGQRGIANVSDRYAQQVPGLADVVQVAGGREHSVALRRDGSVWAFGSNAEGQLGQDLSLTSTSTPQRVPFPSGVQIRFITAGGTHNLALDQNGRVWAWGSNDHGQLGQGNSGNSSPTPVQVKGEGCTGTLSGAVLVKAGYDFSLAVVQEGGNLVLYAWGLNDRGQLGIGDTVDALCPRRILAWAPSP